MIKNEYNPDYAISPWATVAEGFRELDEPAWRVAALPYETLLAGMEDGEITEVIAEQLEGALKVPKDFWLRLERQYREALQRGAKKL